MNPNHVPHLGKDLRNITEDERPLTESEKADGVKSVFLPVAMKALVCCISLVLFLLVECAYFVFTVGVLNEAITFPSDECLSGIVTFTTLAASVFVALLVATGIYLLAKLKTEYDICAAYTKVYRFAAPIAMIVFEVLFICAVMIFASAQEVPSLAPTFSSIVAIVVSMLPILTVWNMNDENRLHNFIDSMAKTFNCIALLVAASAVVVKILQS